MDLLGEIKQFLQTKLQAYEQQNKQLMHSQLPALDKVLIYMQESNGKQIRPLFTMLSAELIGQCNEKTYRIASLIETLHMATLVHDDVVDEADQRRGKPTPNYLWGNKVAVLSGDYLFATVMHSAVRNKDYHAIEIISQAVERMSEGELQQLEKSANLDISEEEYYAIIQNKTASLIAACCASGAISVDADADTIAKLEQFGLLAGLAFQIQDDLFDYEIDTNTGKPCGLDIQDKKLTLPLIVFLRNQEKGKCTEILTAIENHSHDKIKMHEILQAVCADKTGIDYTRQKMLNYRNEALEILNQFPQSEARQQLENLLLFITDRKY